MTIRQEEEQKLARLMNDAMDAAMLEAHMIVLEQVTPFSMQPPNVQHVLKVAAKTVLDNLVFDKAVGEIRVIQKVS